MWPVLEAAAMAGDNAELTQEGYLVFCNVHRSGEDAYNAFWEALEAVKHAYTPKGDHKEAKCPTEAFWWVWPEDVEPDDEPAGRSGTAAGEPERDRGRR